MGNTRVKYIEEIKRVESKMGLLIYDRTKSGFKSFPEPIRTEKERERGKRKPTGGRKKRKKIT